MSRPSSGQIRPLVSAAALTIVGGAAVALVTGILSGSDDGDQAQNTALTTTPVARRDLSE